ncbi:hypothetical protein ACVW0J_007129 [Bradyrhizobium sp. i1.7.7]
MRKRAARSRSWRRKAEARRRRPPSGTAWCRCRPCAAPLPRRQSDSPVSQPPRPWIRPAVAARRGAHGTRPPSGSRKALRRVARKGSWSVSPRRAVGSSRNAAAREDLGRAEQTPVAGKTPPKRAKDCWCARRTARVGVEMSPSEPRERRYAIPMAGMLEMRRPKQQSPIMGGVGHAALPQSWAGRAVFCRFFSLDQRSGEAEILSL